MKVEEIIEGFNRHLSYKRNLEGLDVKGHVVLQKLNTPHKVFKAYKEYVYCLWFVKGSKKYKILSTTIVDKVVSGKEDTIIKKMNIEFCTSFFNWIGGDGYFKVIKGTYVGD